MTEIDLGTLGLSVVTEDGAPVSLTITKPNGEVESVPFPPPGVSMRLTLDIDLGWAPVPPPEGGAVAMEDGSGVVLTETDDQVLLES